MFNHLTNLESVITELYKSGKVENYVVNGVVHSYKIETSEGTIYFDAIRALDVIKHGKSWRIKNPRLMCWNGRWNSQITVSLEDLSSTALYWIVRSI